MSAHCDTCGADLVYDLSCARCDWKARAEAAEKERDELIAAAKVIEIKGLSPESAQLYFDQRNEQADLRVAAEARVTELEAAMRQILDGEDPIRVARQMDDARAALADKEGTP